jgi:hypothetical protein
MLGVTREHWAVGVIPLVSFRLIREANHDEIGHFGFQLWGSGVLSTLKPGIILYCPKLRQPCGFPSDLNQYPFPMGRVGCSAIFISGEVNCTEAIGLFRLIPLRRRYMLPSVRCELATLRRSDIKSPHPRLKFPWLGTV